MNWQARICCIVGVAMFILAIGFFGLMISKHCVVIKEPIKSTTPVMDKVHADVEKVLRGRK